MILVIDTTRSDGLIVALVHKNKLVATRPVRTEYKHGEKLLPVIRRLLKSKKLTPPKLSGIIVVHGPGRFSAVRAGVVVANSLATATGIPVMGVPAGSLTQVISAGLRSYKLKAKSQKLKRLVLPLYGREPHITLQKISTL